MSIVTRGGDSRGQEEGTKVKATKTSGGGGDASRSYDPPKECNFSSFVLYLSYNIVVICPVGLLENNFCEPMRRPL